MDFITHLFLFFVYFAECVSLISMSVWRLAFLFSLLPLFSSLLFSHCTNFFLSLELEAPLCACGLFTRNTDLPSEVWLTHTEKGEKYEWIRNTPTLHFPPLFQNSSFIFLPLYMLLCHLLSRMSVRVYSCKARGAANTGQRLIFVARPVCILTACRRLGGQLLLPAPFPHPRVSPESLCKQPLLSHF